MIKQSILIIGVACVTLMSANCEAGILSGALKLFSHADEVVKVGSHADEVVKVGSHADDVAKVGGHADDVAKGAKEIIKHGGHGTGKAISTGKKFSKKITPKVAKNSKEIKVPKGMQSTILATGAAGGMVIAADNITGPVGEGLGESAKKNPEKFLEVVKAPITLTCVIITGCVLFVLSPLLLATYRFFKRITQKKKPKSDPAQ